MAARDKVSKTSFEPHRSSHAVGTCRGAVGHGGGTLCATREPALCSLRALEVLPTHHTPVVLCGAEQIHSGHWAAGSLGSKAEREETLRVLSQRPLCRKAVPPCRKGNCYIIC
eukprot:7145485-Prymnesium_polylepis.1